MNDRLMSIFLIFAFAVLLAMLSLRRDQLASLGVVSHRGADQGLNDFNNMRGDAGYMNYNWAPRGGFMQMMPTVSQGGQFNPAAGISGFLSPCGGNC